ncbi:MAG TPA: GNAT family N-acetyltransferase [Caldilineaceae bacterium]|nr:GNAT family N-acetyltransferase [Caldilineaceae bacterium]
MEWQAGEANDQEIELNLELLAQAEEQAHVRRAIMEQIAAPAAYALVEVNNGSAAVGSAVVEAGWVGLFNIGVAPQARRQGAAQAAMRALLAWAAAEGATRAYLQVMLNNGPALALYTRLGFVTQYHYHYREQPR